MHDVFLGRTEMKVCRMGFGGIPIQRLALAESDRVLEAAIDHGIRFFDTARIYTDSESKFGRVLPRFRKDVVIATKTFCRDAAGAARDLETSLGELRVDCIDLYQLHNVASAADWERVIAPAGALEALSKAKKEGKIRHIGISTHKPHMALSAIDAFPFVSLQVPFNHMETAAQKELIPRAREQGIAVIAMKPMGGGNIREMAANFRFIFSSGVDVAIPGMDSVEQVRRNVAVLKRLSLPRSGDMRRLEKERERLGEGFCRRCEYCMPCPSGLPIAFLHVLKNYYFLYDLKDWVWERLGQLAKTYKDCTRCRQCVEKCPYGLDIPEIFQQTWEAILADRGNPPALQEDDPRI